LTGAGAVKIDAYRRNLQRSYLEQMNEKLNGRAPVGDDQRPFIRGELRALTAEVGRAMPRTTDRASRMHLEDVKDQIARILDPKFAPPAPASGPSIFSIFRLDEHESCWPDYTLRLPHPH
jgi:hypothetical protein